MMVWKMIITALFAVAVNSGRKKRKLWTKGMKQRRSEEAALRMGRNKGKVHGLPLHVSGSSSRVQRDIAGRRHVSRSEVVIQPSQFQESASTPSDSLTHDLVGAAQPIEQTHITPVVDGVGLVPQELLSKMGTESRDIGTGFQSTVDEPARLLARGGGHSSTGDLDGAARPIGQTHHVGGLTVFFQETQLTDAAARVVELTPSATVGDLVTGVERQTRVSTAVSFRGQSLDDMDAELSDLLIGSESLVHTHPITKIKVQFEDFSVDGIWIDLNKWCVPTEDRVIEVRYDGVLCPATWLFDYLRGSLVHKLQDGQWDQPLTEIGFEDAHGVDLEELYWIFDSALARGDQLVFMETNVKNILKPPYESTSEYSQALESLQQHRIDIDMEQLEQMIATVISEDPYRIIISCTILD